MSPALRGNAWARSGRAVRSGPAGGPALVDLVGQLRHLGVLHLIRMGERRVELGSALVLALEAAGYDDRVSLVVEVLRIRPELVEVLRHGGEDILPDALRAPEGPTRGVAASRFDPLDVIGQDREHPPGGPGVEVLVAAANGLHVLLR